MYPKVEPYFRREEDGALLDHYYYGTYLDGTPVLWPGVAGVYGFMGPGPETPTWSSILLGTLNALFSAGQRHGPPDHLKVLEDDTIESCGTKDRRIKLLVVDDHGRRVGTTSTRETFHDPNTGAECPGCAYNSCRGEYITPSSCSEDAGAIFRALSTCSRTSTLKCGSYLGARADI
jgi:hypothetical protein